jgi:hypothetical protein
MRTRFLKPVGLGLVGLVIVLSGTTAADSVAAPPANASHSAIHSSTRPLDGSGSGRVATTNPAQSTPAPTTTPLPEQSAAPTTNFFQNCLNPDCPYYGTGQCPYTGDGTNSGTRTTNPDAGTGTGTGVGAGTGLGRHQGFGNGHHRNR